MCACSVVEHEVFAKGAWRDVTYAGPIHTFKFGHKFLTDHASGAFQR